MTPDLHEKMCAMIELSSLVVGQVVEQKHVDAMKVLFGELPKAKTLLYTRLDKLEAEG